MIQGPVKGQHVSFLCTPVYALGSSPSKLPSVAHKSHIFSLIFDLFTNCDLCLKLLCTVCTSLPNQINHLCFLTVGLGYHLLQEAFFDFPKLDQGLSCVLLHGILIVRLGNSLPVQWLGLGTFTAVGRDLIPDQGTKISQAAQRGQQTKKSLLTCLKPPLNCAIFVDGEHIFICISRMTTSQMLEAHLIVLNNYIHE